jgi:hypothetical protein
MIRMPRLPAILGVLLGLAMTAAPASAQSVEPYPPAQTIQPYPGQAPTPGQPAEAYPGQEPPESSTHYTAEEIVGTGHKFFGKVTEGLASVVEHAVQNYGLPNGYVLGQEGAGAIVGGLRYGEGTLYTKNAGQHQVYWQGPSIGFDLGAEGNRTMMLIYNMPSVEAIYDRYAGVAGSAYLVAGVGMTVLSGKGIYVVPIVSGVGARLGVNLGYLKFTPNPTWNPF